MSTVAAVVFVIVGSALLFVGANKLFDLATRRWSAFCTLVGAGSMFSVFGLLWGNRLIEQPVAVTATALVLGGLTGYVFSIISSGTLRLYVGTVSGVLLGTLLGVFLKQEYRPVNEVLVLILLIGFSLAVGLLIWHRKGRRTSVVRPLLLWATIGWIIGVFFYPQIGPGSLAWTVIAAAITGAGLGAWVGMFPQPDLAMKRDISLGSRKYIFLTPALGFILLTLVIPLIRTIWMSFLTGLPKELVWTGLSNYKYMVTDPNIIDFSDWREIFTSRLFFVGVGVLVIGLIVARISGRRTGDRLDLNGGSLAAFSVALMMFGLAFFTVVRGTISNNLWWIFVVTIFSTGAGLAMAVLTTRIGV